MAPREVVRKRRVDPVTATHGASRDTKNVCGAVFGAFAAVGSANQCAAIYFPRQMRRMATTVALLAGACSPAAHATEAGVAEGGGSTCLFNCVDASFDGPLALQVRAALYSCAADDCHNVGQANLVLGTSNDFDALIDVVSYEMPPMVRVAPGDPLQSYLYLKVRCEGGIQQSCMPGGVFDPHVAQLFHDWIEAGAPTR